MFSFLKKKKDGSIYAPIAGLCLDITKCKDKTFSEKLMGDGFMIEPTESVVCSPCDGELTTIFPTKHAFGMKMENGLEVIVHIGLDTVELNGQYFELLSSANKKIKKGTPVVKFDMNEIKKAGFDHSVIVIILNKKDVYKRHLNENVNTGDIIIEGKYENY